MTDLQQAITRLRAADEQHPDFWGTLQDRDADPQMLRDVVAVARAYVRNQTTAHDALYRIQRWAKDRIVPIANRRGVLLEIEHKAAEGLGE